AALQGVVALGQYRTNPSGQLIVPPGPTIGVTHPSNKRSGVRSVQTEIPAFATSSYAAGTSSPNSTSDTPIANLASMTPPSDTSDKTLSEGNNRYTRILNTVNRWMVLLVPWIARQVSFVLARNTHFFHLAFIVTISRVFDLPHYWAFQRRLQSAAVGATESSSHPKMPTTTHKLNGNTEHTSATTTVVADTLATNSKPIYNVLVLGDSLAVGLGSVDIFNSTKDNTLDYELIQNLDVNRGNNADLSADETGPIFPRVLAETLSDMQDSDVCWRSAGVDGGDTQHILDFCLPVLEEEVQQGRAPQIVVLLCGINDLKSFMSKPWPGGNPGPRIFRQRLQSLIDSIHQLAPNCTIVLPATPTQMFRKNSPMNIFPFNFVMDSLIGFWDSFKMGVADRVVDGDDILAPSSTDPKSQSKCGRVYYVRTEPNEVLSWYRKPNPLESESSSHTSTDKVKKEEEQGLIAGDGVHPNAKCYALWAQSLAERLLPQSG
ncbi:MAG: hypothetical protein SGILL_004296, partial [Bacillariaceae sp.]